MSVQSKIELQIKRLESSLEEIAGSNYLGIFVSRLRPTARNNRYMYLNILIRKRKSFENFARKKVQPTKREELNKELLLLKGSYETYE